MTNPNAHSSARKAWTIWIACTVIAFAILGAGLFTTRAADHPLLAQVRQLFVPGRMTSGHHQIELACESCHTSPFGGRELMQDACMHCHGDALTKADDKHPLSKFTDPRNAELLAHFDARECATCHIEHRPEITHAMGVTQPLDVCVNCHRDIATERPSHKDMKFDTCASSGCHHFHDNRALYEDFLLKHAAEPDNKPNAHVLTPNFLEIAAQLPTYPSQRYPLKALSIKDIDSSGDLHSDATEMQHAKEDWLASSHARAGVNCSSCHQAVAAKQSAWIAHPDQKVCGACHALQQSGFLSGKHGMRVKAGLSAMTPAQGQLAFKSDASHKELNCISCHGAHRFDVRYAAAQACLTCHDDKHSLAYERSPHAKAWREELAHPEKKDTGVSCASCHMPRVAHEYEDYEVKQIYVEHNQNDTLRPSDKMLRPVCMNCHGLRFSIDALADRSLVDINFNGKSAHAIDSIEMAQERLRVQKAKKKMSVAAK